MSITKINKSIKYIDHEKIFLEEFKKNVKWWNYCKKKINYLDIVFIKSKQKNPIRK